MRQVLRKPLLAGCRSSVNQESGTVYPRQQVDLGGWEHAVGEGGMCQSPCRQEEEL